MLYISGIISTETAARAGCVVCGMLLAAVIVWAVWERQKRERQVECLCEYLVRVQDGGRLPELSGCMEGNMGVLESEIYKLVVQLRNQSEDDMRQKKYLADMLSDISHQIKTPLTSITIMTDLIKDEQMSGAQRAVFVDNIDSQISRMMWLVRNLLTLSRLEADVLKLNREHVSVRELLIHACAPFELVAGEKGVTLELEADERMEMICDFHWTMEAVSNIVKNCIEHTPSGGKVMVSARQNNFAVSVCVADNGEGIAEKDLAHIFERFYKGSGAKTDSVGIGLALSRQIIMRQNGVIRVESSPGNGTVFYIRMYSDVSI